MKFTDFNSPIINIILSLTTKIPNNSRSDYRYIFITKYFRYLIDLKFYTSLLSTISIIKIKIKYYPYTLLE